MFRDREEAGERLAAELKSRDLRDPLVLAIPRGGVVVGVAVARELDCDLDVPLARKLRAPGQPELAIGAIAEDGAVYLNEVAASFEGAIDDYIVEERARQLAEIERRRKLVRSILPQAPIKGRSIILTDDGIATGATMIASLQMIRAARPDEIIVAVPVGAPEHVAEISRLCDDVVCLLSPESFRSVGQFYRDFAQVSDEEFVRLLRFFAPSHRPRNLAAPNGASPIAH